MIRVMRLVYVVGIAWVMAGCGGSGAQPGLDGSMPPADARDAIDAPAGDAAVIDARPDAGPPGAFATDVSALDFGLVEGGIANDRVVTITNVDVAPIGAPTATVTGPIVVIENGCPATLAVGESCTVTVRLAPTSIGQLRGTLSLSSASTIEIPVVAIVGGRITVVRDGAGSGRVESGELRIDCGATCSDLFTEEVELAAIPAGGSVVTWSVPGCVGPECRVLPSVASRTVTATFGAPAPAGFATVWAIRFGAPANNVNVTFNAPDGSIVAEVLTSSSGIARGPVAPGSSVTVVDTAAPATRFVTVLEVGPGDTIVVGEPNGPFTPTNATVVLPPAPTSDAWEYRVQARCISPNSRTQPTVSLQGIVGCRGRRPMIGELRLGPFPTSSTLVRYLEANDVTFDDGSTFTVDPATPWLVAPTFDAQLSNLPSGTAVTRLQRWDGAHLRWRTDFGASTTFPVVLGGDASAVGAEVFAADGGVHAYEIGLIGSPLTVSRDLANTALPAVGSASFTRIATRANFAPTHLDWTEGPGAARDGVELRMFTYDDSFRSLATWVVYAPPGATSFDLPTLSPDLFGLWDRFDVFVTSVRFTFVESSVIDSFAEFRRRASPTPPSVAPVVRGTEPTLLRTYSICLGDHSCP